jgi:capsular polysaccharide biosynthesis protein
MAIKERIVHHLHLENQDKGLTAKVNFKLNQNAQVIAVRIVKSSGRPSFDAAVATAVRDSFPYDDLLKLSKDDYQHFTDLNVTIEPE